jgi:hypothetical protein
LVIVLLVADSHRDHGTVPSGSVEAPHTAAENTAAENELELSYSRGEIDPATLGQVKAMLRQP